MIPSLKKSEKRLTLISVGILFVFLLLFQSFFLVTRYFFEKSFQKEDFEGQIVNIINRPIVSEDGKLISDPKPPVGLFLVFIDSTGDIIESPPIFGMENMNQLISREERARLPKEKTVLIRDTLFRIVPAGRYGDRFMLFARTGGYLGEDILRDIFRLFGLNLVFLIPIYFLSRFLVRRALIPVDQIMDSMSHFIHDAGHELKTPLSILSGHFHILKSEKKFDQAIVEEGIDTIMSMKNSIDSLLDLASIAHPLQIETTPILALVRASVKEFEEERKRKDITIDINIHKDIEYPIAPTHFTLLCNNLLKNAILYNKPYGSITIEATRDHFSIADTGIGIPEAYRERIWERFYRVDRSGVYEGSGIGLSIVSRICDLYGWEKQVESSKKGTRFILSLPKNL